MQHICIRIGIIIRIHLHVHLDIHAHMHIQVRVNMTYAYMNALAVVSFQLGLKPATDSVAIGFASTTAISNVYQFSFFSLIHATAFSCSCNLFV